MVEPLEQRVVAELGQRLFDLRGVGLGRQTAVTMPGVVDGPPLGVGGPPLPLEMLKLLLVARLR